MEGEKKRVLFIKKTTAVDLILFMTATRTKRWQKENIKKNKKQQRQFVNKYLRFSDRLSVSCETMLQKHLI